MNIGQVLQRTVERAPESIGLVDTTADVRYTYETWFKRCRETAAALEARGIGQGDYVGAAMRNRVEFSTLYCATQLLGAVFVPYNFRSSSDELTYLVENTDPGLLFYSREVSEAVEAADWTASPTRIPVDSGLTGDVSYENFLSTDEPDMFTPRFVDPDEVSMVLHTGGTTGEAKLVPRTHRSTYTAAVAHALQNYLSQGESTLGLMSLSHTMGLHSLAATLLLGGKWVIQRSFSAPETVHLIESEEISCLYLVPTVYHDLVHSAATDEADFSSVEHITYAGANMRPATIREIQSQFDPETFVNHYGSTEVYTHAVCDWVREKPNCVGRAGINSAVRVVEPSDYDQLDPTATVADDDLGEIIVDATSPEAFGGYLDDTVNNQAIADGWFFTGDLGYRDEDGDLFYVGRIDDMIISGGENIYPVEVESVLQSHEAVAEAAVVGRPSERWNQTVAAFVTLADEPADRNFTDVAEVLNAHTQDSKTLADFKRPRKYYFIGEFSKSNVGKILRRELQKPDLDVDVHAVVDISSN
jgi:2-furoate---CoA ligase